MRVAAEWEEEEEGAEAMPLQQLAGGLEPLLVLHRNSALTAREYRVNIAGIPP
jgi:hypothetical protein